eukprot:scaffold18207_cov129-Isochrysis_galbana.AAC.4
MRSVSAARLCAAAYGCPHSPSRLGWGAVPEMRPTTQLAHGCMAEGIGQACKATQRREVAFRPRASVAVKSIEAGYSGAGSFITCFLPRRLCATRAREPTATLLNTGVSTHTCGGGRGVWGARSDSSKEARSNVAQHRRLGMSKPHGGGWRREARAKSAGLARPEGAEGLSPPPEPSQLHRLHAAPGLALGPYAHGLAPPARPQGPAWPRVRERRGASCLGASPTRTRLCCRRRARRNTRAETAGCARGGVGCVGVRESPQGQMALGHVRWGAQSRLECRGVMPAPVLQLRRLCPVLAQVDVARPEDAVRVVLVQVQREEEFLWRGRQHAALELHKATRACGGRGREGTR